MALRKPVKKKTTTRKVRLKVDPARLALAGVERIKTVLTRIGHLERFAEPAAMRDLLARENVISFPLPPSYDAAMKVSASYGDPERMLTAVEMRQAYDAIVRAGAEKMRYYPFCAIGDRYVCFDRQAREGAGELAIVEWAGGGVRFLAAHFGEWLDTVADSREEELERSASIPMGLKKLLVQLGFNFDDPIVGRLETGDIRAIEELLGDETTREVRGSVDRLFDSSGKASLTLNLDEFSLAVSLRTGIHVFETEDVFRWLRSFRDENFFGDNPRHPSHPDQVRDLRKAPREPALVLRGVIEVNGMPAKRYAFRAASGRSADDFYLLGRTASRSDRSPSLLLHVIRGEVRDAHGVDEPLNDLYVTADGTVWGLTQGGQAVRFAGGTARAFALTRATRGRSWWSGIGAGGDRVLAWGAGSLLEFDGERFAPFSPDASLDPDEIVVSVWANKREIAMLVCGDHVGAVARYDGKKWMPIGDHQVIDTMLADLDIWRGIAIVLARDGRVFRIEDGAPRPVIWDRRQEAFLQEGAAPRPTHSIRGFDGGAMIASDGGVIVVGSGDPIFYSAGATREPARIYRVGGGARRDAPAAASGDSALIAMCGPHVWLWKNGGFSVLDLREW